MGILIGLEEVSHEWPNKRVLTEQTVGIYEGDRIGVVGRNGDGKSTLLSIIDHSVEPDAGSVTWRGGISVGVLGQQDHLDDDDTVEQGIFGDTERYVWASEPRIREILSALLGDVDLSTPIGTLSGGQRRRVDLARLLVGTWDVLLMDEPTNHLDMVAIRWLADHLKERWPQGKGALLCVTHDRWFLDEVCTSMWEVHDGVIDPFEGGYSAYIQQRLERERLAQVKEERRQNMLRRELAWLSRGAQARSSKPKFRIAEAQAMVADVPELRNPVELKRMAMARLGKKVFDLEDVSVAYDDGAPVLDAISWLIGPGDRYGILGANGAGKSTLLRTILGEQEPTSGAIKRGASVKLGVMDQNLDQLRERGDWTVAQLLAQYKRSYVVGGKERTPTQLLEQLGFEKGEVQSRLKDLSGGQLRRLGLLCVLLDEPNVLVLDEPGNDMDTDMLAVMEDLLDEWPGTLLLVTHDRYLMERVTDDQYGLVDGHLRHFPGGVDQFLETLDHGIQGTVETAPVDGAPAGSHTRADGLTNAERRAARKRFDATDRKLERLRDEPDRIRSEMAAADPSDFQALEKLQGELDATLAQIGELEDTWLELSELLDIQ